MKKFTITLTIHADSVEHANQVRDEAMSALEDARDSGELPAGVSFDMDMMQEVGNDLQTALVAAARDEYATGSDDNIEVDDSAAYSEGDDGIFVQGWLFLNNALLRAVGIDNPALAPANGEGDAPAANQ